MFLASLFLLGAAAPEYALLPVDPIAKHGTWSVAIDASLLVWQAQAEGLEFAAKNTPRYGISSAIPIDINATLEDLHFSWEPAYKLNVIFQSFGTGWDIDFRWTNFYSRSSRSVSEPAATNGSGLLPLWLLPDGNNGAAPLFGHASATWQLHFSGLDWELGHSFQLSKMIDIRFFGGLKALILDQIYRVEYGNGLNNGSIGVVSGNAKMENEYWGVGPRCGLRSGWTVADGWSIQAASAISFVLSQFHITREDADVAITLPSTDYVTDTTFLENFWVYRPAFEGLIGLRWDGQVAGYTITTEAAYEMQYYWEQNMFMMLVNSSAYYDDYPRRGDLTLQGFTGTIRCAF